MPKILVLGAGLVARPLVRYLLEQPDFSVTVAEQLVEKAEALVAGAANGRAVQLTVGSPVDLGSLIAEHDVTVSLLPANMHAQVARQCVDQGRHMVTASYVTPAMEALDGEARAKGLTILNEVGVDPGLDHMSAMRIIHDIRRRGGIVTRFQSFCGGVPAPEANDNPWGYKMSWSPRGVCMAANSSARYARRGEVVTVEGAQVFASPDLVEIEGFPPFESYPNRDSLKYVELYGMKHVQTMFRGTLRYAGWCETMRTALELDLFNDQPLPLPENATLAQFMAQRVGADPNRISDPGEVRRLLAEELGLAEDSKILERFAWLGLFSDTPVLRVGDLPASPLDILADAMTAHLSYAPGERDVIAMKHFFVARFEHRNVEEHLTSTLISYGVPDGDSAMSRTVGLPAGVAAKQIATGVLDWPGVQIPVKPEIYDPILDELASEGISFVEVKYTEPL